MSALAIALILIVIVLVSAALTAALRHYAVRRSLMDIPNARSAHTIPTPRGGGLAIVICVLAIVPVLAWAGLMEYRTCWALLGAGGLIASIGFADDHGHIAVRWRLLTHFLAAAWVVLWLGGAPPFELAGLEIGNGWGSALIATIYLAWMVNLYNFMDGIDGIAAVEAITVCLAAATLHALVLTPSSAVLPLTVAAASAGFLYWNLPPAKIFLGDVGSGFLGVVLGTLSLQAGWLDSRLLWAWLILLGVFVVDATFTLLHRLYRGEKLHQAHRSHAYQRAARRVRRHLPVTLAVGAINLLWLFPIALLVGHDWLSGLTGLFLAYFPLVFVAQHLRAGASDES